MVGIAAAGAVPGSFGCGVRVELPEKRLHLPGEWGWSAWVRRGKWKMEYLCAKTTISDWHLCLFWTRG